MICTYIICNEDELSIDIRPAFTAAVCEYPYCTTTNDGKAKSTIVELKTSNEENLV
jgi:hypothetical protein